MNRGLDVMLAGSTILHPTEAGLSPSWTASMTLTAGILQYNPIQFQKSDQSDLLK